MRGEEEGEIREGGLGARIGCMRGRAGRKWEDVESSMMTLMFSSYEGIVKG